jgi:hypothetical protein
LPKPRRVRRGRLLRTPRAAQTRLHLVRDFLDWVYCLARSDEEIKWKFWQWLRAASTDRVRRKLTEDWWHLLAESAELEWAGIQADTLRRVEEILGGRPVEFPTSYVPTRWELGTWKGPDGERYFQYAPAFDPQAPPALYVTLAIQQVIRELSGLNVKVLGRCKECRHYFVRLVSRRSFYCSSTCRWRGFMAQRGYRPRRRRPSDRTVKPTRGQEAWRHEDNLSKPWRALPRPR